MPPTNKLKKNNYCLLVYDIQKSIGLIAMSPCTRCEKRSLRCLVAPGYSRCSECIKAGGRTKCDVYSPLEAEWRRIEREDLKLKSKREATLDE